MRNAVNLNQVVTIFVNASSRYLLSVAFFVMVFLQNEAVAQTSSYGELQGAYIFNFAKYIKWPDNVKTLTIGVYGDSDIAEDLFKTMEGKKAGMREIILKEITSPEMAIECEIIYLPEANSRDLSVLKQATIGKSILIVTEEDLIRKGAGISFVIEDDRLRFKLKKSILAEAGLTVSEGLLKIAIVFN